MPERLGSRARRTAGRRATAARDEPHREGPREAARDKRRAQDHRFAVVALIVVVIGAVFLGSRCWHGMFGSDDDYRAGGVKDVVIEVHNGDSTTVIGQTLLRPGGRGHGERLRRRRVGQRGDELAIQPGFYKVRTEIPAVGCRCAACGSAEPGGSAGDPRGPPARRHRRREDQRRHPGHLRADLRRHLRRSRRHRALREGRRSEARPRARPIPRRCPSRSGRSTPVKALGTDHRRIEGLIAPGTWNVDPSASAPGDPVHADRSERRAVRGQTGCSKPARRRTCRRTRS